MKKTLKFIVMNIIFIFLIGVYDIVYAVDKFVDIPVPPNSSGKADFTSEEGEKEAAQYEKDKIINGTEKEEYIEKSGNNYLKSLTIEGYKIDPDFNMQKDEYILYVKDKNQITTLNIIAETEDKNAKIEGAGKVSITPNTNIVTINVIAENGNLKVYTIKIENQLESTEIKNIDETNEAKHKNNYMIVASVIIAIIIAIISIRKINKR